MLKVIPAYAMIGALAIVLVVIAFLGQSRPVGGQVITRNQSGFATSGVMTITAGQSSRILATSTAREYAVFSSDCGNPVYLQFNADTPAPGLGATGVLIGTTSPNFEVTLRFPYTGSVRASSSVACKVFVGEAQN
jgi:hypothetical protein